MNVDATVSNTSNGGALGVVCRREDGSFLGASALTIQGIVDPTILKAMAYREALALAEDLYLQKIVVASDCLTVTRDMEKPFEGSYSMILQEIKSKSQEFSSIVFKFKNKFSYSEAHVVVRSSVASEFGRQVCLMVFVFL
jgi:fructose-1,6-bisphosphatase/sedoheptulose 1,7-bisphosphatase-like protein